MPQYRPRPAAQQVRHQAQHIAATQRRYFFGWPVVASGMGVGALQKHAMASIGGSIVGLFIVAYGLGSMINSLGGVRNPISGLEGMITIFLVSAGITLVIIVLGTWLGQRLPMDMKDDSMQMILLLVLVVPVLTLNPWLVVIGILVWIGGVPAGKVLTGSWRTGFAIVLPAVGYTIILLLVFLLTATLMLGGNLKPGESAATVNKQENVQRGLYVVPTVVPLQYVPGTGGMELDDFPQKFPELGSNARSIVLGYCAGAPGARTLTLPESVIPIPLSAEQKALILAQLKSQLEEFCATYNGESPSTTGPGGTSPSGATPRPTFTPRPNPQAPNETRASTTPVSASPTPTPPDCVKQYGKGWIWDGTRCIH